MKIVIACLVAAVLTVSCGATNPMQPAPTTTSHGPCQVAGSTVMIFDQIPGCAIQANQNPLYE